MSAGNVRRRNIDEPLRRIFESRGFDILHYRMSDLQRKVSRRMGVLEISDLAEYSEYLESNSDEYTALFNTIVDVTQFFRNPEAWNFIRENVFPEILERGDEIRIWSAGCASGEEPYSAAIALAEILGDDLSEYAIRIYATDVDEAVLKFARSGTYSYDRLAAIPEEARQKYFTHHDDVYTIVGWLRELVVFSRNNLVSDPPIPRIDLLICRNVLIYFDRALQSRIASKLKYALNDGGYLWLGKAETLSPDALKLKPLDTKWRIFKNVPSSSHPQLVGIDHVTSYTDTDFMPANERAEQTMQGVRAGFIVLDRDFSVVMCSQIIQDIWGRLPEQVLGMSFFDLEISYRPLDLRHKIEQTLATRQLSVVENTEHWINQDKRVYLKVEIIPLVSGIVMLLEDITKQYEVSEELRIAYKALETGNENFLSINKELEDINLQYQSINEELQSTNAELESTNEELSATNEKLITQLTESDELNCYYETVMNSMDLSIIVTDESLLVRTWNAAAAHLWGGEDNDVVGKSLMSLDMGLPIGRLSDRLRDAMEKGDPTTDTLGYIDRWGGRMIANVSINPLMSKESEGKPRGLVLVIQKLSPFTKYSTSTRRDDL